MQHLSFRHVVLLKKGYYVSIDMFIANKDGVTTFRNPFIFAEKTNSYIYNRKKVAELYLKKDDVLFLLLTNVGFGAIDVDISNLYISYLND